MFHRSGVFRLDSVVPGRQLLIMASEGDGWEHVSVHAQDVVAGRSFTPTWAEMCAVKDAFWDAEDLVIQYHPRKSEYRDFHKFTLHLWRPIGVELPRPDPDLVGPAPLAAEHAPA